MHMHGQPLLMLGTSLGPLPYVRTQMARQATFGFAITTLVTEFGQTFKTAITTARFGAARFGATRFGFTPRDTDIDRYRGDDVALPDSEDGTLVKR